MNAGYGLLEMIRMHVQLPIMGKVLVVCPTSDANYNRLYQMVKEDNTGDGTQIRLYTTLETAYAAATTNANDVIVLAGNATHTVATGIAWSKSRIHVLGMDGGDHLVQQGAKIELTGAVDVAYVLKVTGNRNSFRNLKVIQSSTHANALNVIQYAGEGNLYKNVSVMFGTNSNTDLTTSAEALMGEDSGTFINCSWGNDNLLSTGARNIMAFDAITGSASSGAGAKNNRFIDCEWIVCTSEANTVLVKVVDTGAVEYLNAFIRPRFHAILHAGAGGVAITNAVQSVASLTGGCLHLYMPGSFDCTNLCATLTANVKTYGAVTSAQGGEAGTPS